MALPTLAVTPGTGAVINTNPPGGQALGASSLPVVIASDQPAVPVTSTVPANLATAQASVGTTATPIVPVRTGRAAVTIENHGTTPVYIGASGVTATTGILLPGTVGASITIPTQAAVYGIVASGTQVVGALETY